MRFKCPHCGQALESDSSLSGRKIACPSCGGHIEFEASVEVVDEAAAEEKAAVAAPADVRTMVKTLWSGSVPASAEPTMSLKGDRRGTAVPRERPSESVSARLNVISKHVADSGAQVQPPPEYELLARLGEGGMGVVFRARQASVDRTIALKMMKAGLSQEKEERDRFLAEAVATADLDHPNIVPIYDLGSNRDGTLFYAMKEVKGRSWKDMLAEKPEDENLEILMRVADAVAFAHSKGVIHRDLKPENVMLGDYGEVLVMDWGLAAGVRAGAKAERLDGEHVICGTPCYMAPEMAKGEAEKLGVCSDVYLLGAMLYEIVTGKRPHAGKDAMDCLANAAENRIDPTEKDGELLEIALKAMATDPGDRYPGVREFQEAVGQYRQHEESLRLAAHAAEELKEGEKTKEYARYQRAVAGYEQALTLWSGNRKAAEGLSRVRLSYAAAAHAKDDFDLALSMLSPADEAHAGLLKKVKADRQERAAHRQRLRMMKIVSAFSAAAAIVVLSAGIVWVSAAERRAIQALANFKAEQVRRQTDRKSSAPALVRSARIFIDQKQFRDAVATLETAVEYDPELTEARVLHTAVLCRESRFNEALKAAEAYAERFPSDEEARQVLRVCANAARTGSTGMFANEMAQVLQRRRALTLAAEFMGTPDQALRFYREHLDKAWPGSGEELKFSKDTGMSLSLYGRTDVLDLSPLKGIPLMWLDLNSTKVSDLTPLTGMPLRLLRFSFADVIDLTPLKGMPLTELCAQNTKVLDLSPLKGMPLKWLDLNNSRVLDLSPLEGMPLAVLMLSGTKVDDLSSLKGMPLVRLEIHNTLIRDLSPLAGMSLTELKMGGTGVTDLSPLKGMPLVRLEIHNTLIRDLSPLAGMSLTELRVGSTGISDLSPLRGMPLRWVDITGSRVDDLTPLKGIPLARLDLHSFYAKPDCPVTDLTPLEGMRLNQLWFDPTLVKKGLDVVRNMKSLSKIFAPWSQASFAPAEFWEKYDAGEFNALTNAPSGK